MPTTKIQGTTTNTLENSHVWTPKIMEVNGSNDAPLWLKFGVLFLGEPNQLGSKWSQCFPMVGVFFQQKLKCGCFRKYGVFPPNHPSKNRVFHYKTPSILGAHPYFFVYTHGSTPEARHIYASVVFSKVPGRRSATLYLEAFPNSNGKIPNRGGRNGGVGKWGGK